MRLKIDWASLIVGSKFTVFALFYFAFEALFYLQAPGGLIFGILRCTLYTDLAEMHRGMRYGEGDNCIQWHEAYFNVNSNVYTDEYRTMKIEENK